MQAMKGPSNAAFKKAIIACSDANMMHLEAMTRERYAAFLDEQNATILANNQVTTAYWLYQDWGADAKALELLQSHPFLEVRTILTIFLYISLP